MSVLPENTFLGALEIVEIYEYLDRPLLFACKNTTDSLYIVLHESETDTFDRWIYVNVSLSRFEAIRIGSVDLRAAFKDAENEFVFLINLPHDPSVSAEIRALPAAELQDQQLPDAGERLNLTVPLFDIPPLVRTKERI
jgi:hypothetical protein